MKRASGVLMHISSLPGPYGIGSFGKEAVSFGKTLRKAGFTYWQVLPFGLTDRFHSPYKSESAFAGNPWFIDLEQLAENGLLTSEDLSKSRCPEQYAAAYAWLEKTRLPLLHKAFSRLTPAQRGAVTAFCEAQAHWLLDFALYMALKDRFQQKPWYAWDAPYKDRAADALARAQKELSDEILFHAFLQYTFYAQWARVKEQLNQIGLRLIGDMPIYVSLESADVWAGRGLFALNQTGMPKSVAGVPPDYFSADGQKWGNPLYDWAEMKKDGYAWWLHRLESAFQFYDLVRIDHFRAFSSYWSVPAEAKTAKEGVWTL